MSDALEAKLATVEAERDAAQYMLAFVLLAVGEPVVITAEMLTNGLPKGAEIEIEEDRRSDWVTVFLTKDKNE